jgi:hypothetical protein
MSLAETLHCTLYELKSRITEEEMLLWQLHFSRKAKLQKEEMEKAKRKR